MSLGNQVDPMVTADQIRMARAALKSGVRELAARAGITPLDGEPPKSRVTLIEWESEEKIKAWRNSAAYKELMPMREKLAKFRTFTLQGLSQ